MSSQDEYVFWQLAHYLISKRGYRIIQLAKNQKELWLEKWEDKEIQVIRLLLHNLDWSNWLQRDIEITASNGERIRKQLHKRAIHVLNIYCSPYPPVDDYQFRIEKPFCFSNNDKTKITSVICHQQNRVRSVEAIMQEEIPITWKDFYTEIDIEEEKHAALSTARKKENSEKALFENGKPFFTYLFIAIQVIVFIMMENAGGSTSTSVLVQFGAKVNWLILEGDWWRLFTPIFVHIGIFHLIMNTVALYYLGTSVERIYGRFRYLFIYIVAGVFGTLGSLMFSPNISAGASGAIFGCFGALLYFGTVYPKLFFRTMGYNMMVVLGINLVFGFTFPGVDNAGHIGGLIGGFLATAIVHFPKKKRFFVQAASLAVSAALVTGILYYSLNHTHQLLDDSSAFGLAQTYIEKEEYDKAYKLLAEYADGQDDSAELLFLLSFTEIKTGKLAEAKENLHQVIEKKADFHEAFYNLALVYLEENNFEQAKLYAEEAVSNQPLNDDYQLLLDQINNMTGIN